METKIRREEDTLFLSGLAVIIFGIWGSLKICITFFLESEAVLKTVDVDGLDLLLVKIITFAFVLILCLIDLFFRLRIGIPAMKESREKGQSHYYLILAGFYLLTDAIAFLSVFIVPGGDVDVAEKTDLMSRVTKFIIQASSCYVLLQLIISSIKLRRLRRDAGLI